MTYTIVKNDDGDWIGLYGPDGHLLDEGHSFTASRVLELLGVAHDVIYDVPIPESEGHFPASLGDLAKWGGTTRSYRP
jgi:hypothetical protein